MIVNEKIAIDHGLKKDEYKKICELLNRTPNITELGIMSSFSNNVVVTETFYMMTVISF